MPLPILLALAMLIPAQPQVAGPAASQDVVVPTPLAASTYDARDDVFYHFMPIAWRHGEDPSAPADSVQRTARFGNFRGMIDSLPYLAELGVTGVWINPIFPSPAYHGYQHGRADRVNPWFGTEAEFLRFIGAAHGLGIKVYLDLVCYGISHDSPWFDDAFKNPASPSTPMLAFTDAANSKYVGYTFRTWTGAPVGFVNWDLRNAAARALVIGWSTRWLDPNGDGDPSDGVDGYRLDHVWRVYDPRGQKVEGALGYTIDGFWKEWRAALEKVNPAVFTFAEQAAWESFGANLTVTSDGGMAHDAAFSKPFEFAARDALKTETAAGLYEWMGKTLDAIPPGRTTLAILGDHDVDRLASAIGADEAGKAGRAMAAAAVLLLQPLPPVLYYGDELGMLGTAGKFGSDANDIPRREPMPWTEARDGATTEYTRLNAGAWKGRTSRPGDGLSVEAQSGRAGSLLETYRALITLRRKHPALRRGAYAPVAVDSPAVWCFDRRSAEESLRVYINLSGVPVRVTATGGADGVDGANGVKGEGPVEVEAYGWKIGPAPGVQPGGEER